HNVPPPPSPGWGMNSPRRGGESIVIPEPPSLMSPTNTGTIQPAMPPAGTGVVPISAAYPTTGYPTAAQPAGMLPAGIPLPPVQPLPTQFPPGGVSPAGYQQPMMR